ncbi:MAG: PIN domain-containing protein [Coriobacteriales bacterium]|jgi:predicted nucleic acid-binding protein|nr:PIN domain-containing protein [Coriobacteriales bacterium]
MPAAKAFVDTNIFVYIYSGDEQDKRRQALSQIGRFDRVVSTQVLNEFCNVCIRKLRMELSSIGAAVEKICRTNELFVISGDTVKQALFIHDKYEYSYYDSLIIASALESGCEYLLSEDMADGQVIEGSLTIRNVFP